MAILNCLDLFDDFSNLVCAQLGKSIKLCNYLAQVALTLDSKDYWAFVYTSVESLNVTTHARRLANNQ